MGETHDLDHAAAANGRLWAEDVDPTVNRLSGLMLGQLTNVADTNNVTAELPLSTGFTAISDGAIFSFVPPNTNTSAMTMQLKTTAGVDVGAAFGLRDWDGVAFASGAVIAGRLQVFQYNASEGYARRIADASDPVVPVVPISGWTLLETQEPNSDVSTVTFATVVSAYKSLRVEVFAEMTSNGAYAQLQYSPDGSTWRTLALGSLATQAAGVTVNCWDIMNVDDADGTHLRVAHNVHTASKTANIDRSNASTNFNASGIDAQAGTGGYTSYDEDMAYIRIAANTGNMEGSTGDRRSVFRLYGQS